MLFNATAQHRHRNKMHYAGVRCILQGVCSIFCIVGLLLSQGIGSYPPLRGALRALACGMSWFRGHLRCLGSVGICDAHGYKQRRPPGAGRAARLSGESVRPRRHHVRTSRLQFSPEGTCHPQDSVRCLLETAQTLPENHDRCGVSSEHVTPCPRSVGDADPDMTKYYAL